MMNKLKIIVDSTSDFPVEWIKEFDVDIVPLSINWPTGTSELDTRDIKDLSNYYNKLIETNELPKTSQPSIASFSNSYKKAFDCGYDEILVLTLSDKMSGAFNSATLASKDFNKKIVVMNTKTASSAIANMAHKAYRLSTTGKNADEICEIFTNDLKNKKFQAIFSVSDFNFLVKGGRVNKFVGFVGSVLKLRVGIYIDETGEMIPFQKARGTRKTIEMLIDKLASYVDYGSEIGLTMVHCNNEGDIKLIYDELAEKYKIAYMAETPTGKIISTHVGPGMAGFGVEVID
jgi:DegV family protein with EDD domain